MHRRTVIRNIVLASAGVSFLPYCLQENKPLFPLKNIDVSLPQQKMLELLTETIIPHTSGFPGAGDLKAHEFVLTMIDDCAKPEDQAAFIKGLKMFEETCKKKWNKDFEKITGEQRVGFLKEMEADKESKGEAQNFYRTVKRYTIQHFTSSKEFLTDIRKFTLVPGSNFKGCVPVVAKG